MSYPFQLSKVVTTAFILALVLFAPLEAWARIKLITLPPRERVEVHLDNAAVTLVEEERLVPLIQGNNQVDFSWANTGIDPDSIVFRVMKPSGDAVRVLSVSYPPGENALVWNVGAQQTATARVRISYILHQLSRSFSYRALSDGEEKTLSLSQYLKVKNHAGESFTDSRIQAGFGGVFQRSIALNESQKLLFASYANVPIEKTYTADLEDYGYLNAPQKKLKVPMHYVLNNDAEHHLGKTPLAAGKVRIFQTDSQGSQVFIGEDWGHFTPRDDEMALYLGVAQDIVVKRSIEKSEQQRVAGNLYNHKVIIRYEIENFKNKAVALNIAENLWAVRNELRGYTDQDVEWEILDETTFSTAADPEKSSFEKLYYTTDLPARNADGSARKIVHKLAILLKNEWR